MESDYLSDNATERRRLEVMVARLTPDDLARRLDNELTVAQVLVHLAFWDDYCAGVLEQWGRTGYVASHSNYDAVNTAIAALAAAIPAPNAADLAVEAANAVDDQVARLDVGLVATALDGGSERMLRRALHRRQHLDQIERVVGSV